MLSQKLLSLSFALLLAACSQQPVKDVQRPLRESIASYVLEGRVSVRRGNDARQAGIVWQHDTASDVIELSGPLGQNAARLTRDISGAHLQTASRESYSAPDWETLSERVLGVALPLNNMALWATARFQRNVPVRRDASSRPLHAVVDGWQIDYLAYESALPEALPSLIEINRDDIVVRLKVDQWQAN